MTTLKECPRTSFLSDYDLEHHFRTLAGNEERIAQQARTEYALLQTPGSRGAAAFHADKAVKLHRLAEEQAEMHRPVLQMPKQIPDTYWSRRRIQLTLAFICFVAAAGVLGWWLAWLAQ